MFTNAFFLFLILLLIGNVPPPAKEMFFYREPTLALAVFLVAYLCVLGLIAIQSKFLHVFFKVKEGALLILTNIELALVLSVGYFVIGMQQIFLTPHLFPFELTTFTFFSLSLYFLGLFTAHYCLNLKRNTFLIALSKAWASTCFLIPFTIPFFIIIFFSDFSSLISWNTFEKFSRDQAILANVFIFIFTIGVIFATMVLMPPILVLFWKCQPLLDNELVNRLQKICDNVHFRHAGFRVWKIMKEATTAAIFGIVAPFRYVVFTQKLLDRMSENSIEAILAHEIGHSRHHHLIFYPFILAGMIVSGGWFSTVLYQLALQNDSINFLIQNSPFLKSLEPFFIFVIFAMTVGLYFRFIFGFFSRIFERQADIYVFQADIPVENMIEALDHIAILSGNIHDMPNWHHYSIRQRINFLKDCQKAPSLINQHHFKVKISLFLYFSLLILFLLMIKII